MKQSDLDLILENHKKWINGEDGGVKADLEGADLRGADLSFANLGYANLGYANLRYANLRYAKLRGANLKDANLEDADLEDADLWSTTGNQREIKTLQTELWQIVYTDTVIQIGCQRHNIDDWFSFNDEKIDTMDSNALKFWKKWKPILKLILKEE